jgi:hypothetical protein
MEPYDIYQEILAQSLNDVDHFLELCSVNRKSQDICLSRAFWNHIFDQYELEMPPFNYKTIRAWYKHYEKELRFKLYIDKIIMVIKNPLPDYFEDIEHINHIDGILIQTTLNTIQRLLNFNVDKPALSEYCNTIILEAYDDLNFIVIQPKIIIKYIKNNYNILIITEYTGDQIELDYNTNVDIDVIRFLLKIALSNSDIPKANVAGYPPIIL